MHPRFRRFTTAALLVTLTACGTATEPPPTTTAGIEVSSSFGPQHLPAPAKRVVALSSDWLGTMVALGAEIVGYRTDGPAVAMPTPSWLAGKVPDSATRLSGTLDVEAVAAVRPDVIVGPSWLITKDLYAQLARIAPTIVDSDSPDGTEYGSWQRQIATSAALTGKDGAALTAGIITRLRASAARHPGAKGRDYVIAAASGTQLSAINSANTSAGRVMSAYGMTPLVLPGATTAGRIVVSSENLTLVRNAYFVATGSDASAADTLNSFVATRSKKTPTLVMDLPTLNAFNVPDASSIEVIIDKLDASLPTG